MSCKWSRFLSKPFNAYNFSRILLSKKLPFVHSKRQEYLEETDLTNKSTMAANTCREYEFDSSSNENLQSTKCPRNEPIIRSEIDYSQPSSLHSTIPETNDVGTQPCIETDNVYITCEIYSMTDLPACLQPNMQTEPKPGMIIPEYLDGQCMILHAYRCKGVNTAEVVDIPVLCEPLNDHAFSPLDIPNELDKSSREPQQNFEGQNVRQFRLAMQAQLQLGPETILDTADGPMCQITCPNLRITEGTQTMEIVAELEDGNTKSPTRQDILTTIQEQDEESNIYDDDVSMVDSESEYKPTPQTVRTKNEAVGRKRHSAIRVPHSVSDHTDTGKRFRKSASDIFEMGTLLDTHSSAWLDRPKRRKECRVICTRPSDSICSDARVRDSLSCCTNFVQPMNSHSMIQCDTVISKRVANFPAGNQPISCVQYERSDDRCVDHGGSRVCRVETASWTDPNEFWPANCWASRSKRCLGPIQETLMRHQLCRINNIHGYPMTGGTLDNCTQSRSFHDTYNRHYLNCNKAYNTIAGHCFCNNGYNTGNVNTYHAATRSCPGYYAMPKYCCAFSAWY